MLSRYSPFAFVALAFLTCLIWGWMRGWTPALVGAAMITGALALLGLRDLTQTRHAILRNYPILAHFRFLFEYVRPEIRQYFIESDSEAAPSSGRSAAAISAAVRRTDASTRHVLRSRRASGKSISAFDIARSMALGADGCNSARGFMFALGCIQAQTCHTGRCPTGVTTQDPLRQRALHVPSKAERVQEFHASTMKALAELLAAAGLRHPGELRPEHIIRRVSATEVTSLATLYKFLKPSELLGADTSGHRVFSYSWARSSADTFSLVATG